MKNLKLFLAILFSTIVISCQPKDDWKADTYKTQSGWGYTISNSGKIYIKQSVIPVISENKSFKSKEDALQTASLVVEKLKAKKSPSVSKKELEQLNIVD
jgi:hypothetical protein